MSTGLRSERARRQPGRQPAGADGLLVGDGGAHLFVWGCFVWGCLGVPGGGGGGRLLLCRFAAAWVVAKVVALAVGLRVSPEDESTGLDLTQHAESAYSMGSAGRVGG